MTPDWITNLLRKVHERDKGLCVKCGKQAAHVHHIIPRSRCPRWSRKVWREENMVCLCLGCHAKAQTKKAREELLRKMATVYDMAWAAEFGWVM